ncbi:MAG TPA: hypothetical protein VFA71_05130, partial [Terriglobales bacterium]|nr:hypothetical protein [Terriglobales bacterium]
MSAKAQRLELIMKQAGRRSGTKHSCLSDDCLDGVGHSHYYAPPKTALIEPCLLITARLFIICKGKNPITKLHNYPITQLQNENWHYRPAAGRQNVAVQNPHQGQ